MKSFGVIRGAVVQNSRETQASQCFITPRSFIVLTFCGGGFRGEGGGELGCHCTEEGLLYGLSPLCGPRRDLADNYFVAPMVEVFPY